MPGIRDKDNGAKRLATSAQERSLDERQIT